MTGLSHSDDKMSSDDEQVSVLVVGGGPTGLLTGYGLARSGIACVLAEKNLGTTKWPKMDLTNCRSMEILRTWGIAQEYRDQKGAVPDEYQSDSHFYTSMNEDGLLLANWVSDWWNVLMIWR